MATESIQVSGVIHATPESIYNAWLDSNEHSSFTGGKATVEPSIGGRFTAWDGYIQGTNLELNPGRRIVQSWRTTEFPSGSPDSRLEVLFEAAGDGTRVTLNHTEIPPGQATRYEQGWREHHLDPMARYFGRGSMSTSPVPSMGSQSVMEEEPMSAPAPKPAVPQRKAAAKKKPAKRKAAPKKAKKSKKKAKKAKAKKKSARTKKAKKSKARKGKSKKRARKSKSRRK